MAPCAGRSRARAKSRWNRISSGCKCNISDESGLSRTALTHQLRKRRNVAVAFDECRTCADAGDELFIERPDCGADRLVVTIDKQSAFGVHRVTCQMDFTNAVGGHGVQPLWRTEARVVRADHDIVHVNQQAAAAPPGELREEAGLAPAVVAQGEIMGRVFD